LLAAGAAIVVTAVAGRLRSNDASASPATDDAG
jgi:hypothetical protein